MGDLISLIYLFRGSIILGHFKGEQDQVGEGGGLSARPPRVILCSTGHCQGLESLGTGRAADTPLYPFTQESLLCTDDASSVLLLSFISFKGQRTSIAF